MCAEETGKASLSFVQGSSLFPFLSLFPRVSAHCTRYVVSRTALAARSFRITSRKRSPPETCSTLLSGFSRLSSIVRSHGYDDDAVERQDLFMPFVKFLFNREPSTLHFSYVRCKLRSRPWISYEDNFRAFVGHYHLVE